MSPSIRSSLAAFGLSSTEWSGWGLTEGERGKEVKGICNQVIRRWPMDSKLSKGMVGMGETAGQYDTNLCPRSVGRTSGITKNSMPDPGTISQFLT